MRALLLLAALTLTSHAQWDIQNSNTTASLRGIASIGNGVAWASGTNGTVLRTEDGGSHWQHCITPPEAEALDFRGVQAFDENRAIVMSSGKGDLSRLYKTTDGCQTWKLVFTNPDKEGFWDALQFSFKWNRDPNHSPKEPSQGFIIGDSVSGKFPIFISEDGGNSWRKWGRSHNSKAGTCGEHLPGSLRQESLFAASNSSLLVRDGWASTFLFVTGGTSGARIFETEFHDFDGEPCWTTFASETLPIGDKSDSSGAFAAAASTWRSNFPEALVIVGGDYRKPDQSYGTAILLTPHEGFHPFGGYYASKLPASPPHGYRSAVAYDAPTKTWITVGPNGTDISTDDGRNWRALTPGPSEPADADKNWNALSLPFVVGPKGRIGVLRSLKATTP